MPRSWLMYSSLVLDPRLCAHHINIPVTITSMHCILRMNLTLSIPWIRSFELCYAVLNCFGIDQKRLQIPHANIQVVVQCAGIVLNV